MPSSRAERAVPPLEAREVAHTEAALRERPDMADLRRPARGTSRPKAASQDAFLSVSKVASHSSDGGPGIGHKRYFASRPKSRLAVTQNGHQTGSFEARCFGMLRTDVV